MARARLLKLLVVLTHRGAAMSLLAAIAVLHPLVHGTPIDSGTLDASFAALQAWAIGNLHGGAD